MRLPPEAGVAPQAMARLHARTMPGRAWSAAEYAELIEAGAVHTGDDEGFALMRVVADEAELLVVTVAPHARRRGRGRALLEAALAAAARRGARVAHLEVAAGNRAARSLYAATGWRETGRRRGYYGAGEDAVLMSRDIAQAMEKADES